MFANACNHPGMVAMGTNAELTNVSGKIQISPKACTDSSSRIASPTKADTAHTVIPKSSKVALLTGAANRDHRMFPDPDAIDVERGITRHVAFGYGIHFCLGAALARLEGKVALEETLRRFPSWIVDRSRCEMVHTSTVRGYAKVPMSTR